jgi:hypothetical protein
LIQKKQIEDTKNYRGEVYPFQPRIDKSPDVMAYKKKENTNQFIERLVNSNNINNDKVHHKNEIVINQVPSFRPNAHKYPNGERSLSQRKEVVHPNLDGYYDENLIKSKKQVENEEKEFKKSAVEYWKNEANKRILKIKMSYLKGIIEKLDSDNDGLISSRKIKITGLESDLIYKLTPIFEILQKNNMDKF